MEETRTGGAGAAFDRRVDQLRKGRERTDALVGQLRLGDFNTAARADGSRINAGQLRLRLARGQVEGGSEVGMIEKGVGHARQATTRPGSDPVDGVFPVRVDERSVLLPVRLARRARRR